MRAYLEITNICNRQCSFCPGTTRKKLFAPPDVIRARLEKLRAFGVGEMYLHVLGEPLLHPDFAVIADLCQAAGIPVNLTTNGTLLTPDRQEILLTHPVFRQINFSLQALHETETDVLENILDFCKLSCSRRPELYLNLRMWNLSENLDSTGTDRLFFDVICRKLSLDASSLRFRKDSLSLPLAGRLYIHGSPMFEWPVKSTKTETDKTAFCHGVFDQIGILADGTVVPCCLDSDGAVALGNLDTQTLAEILNSPRAAAIRNGFKNGVAAEELCRKCTYRERHAKNKKHE